MTVQWALLTTRCRVTRGSAVEDEQLKESLKVASAEAHEYLVANAEDGVATALEHLPAEVGTAHPNHGTAARTCVICGEETSRTHAKRTADGSLVCKECREKLSDIITSEALAHMNDTQVRQHAANVDRLRNLYATEFTATGVFCSGKKLDHPTLEVDETHGWWALPDSKNPIVFSLESIVDYEMVIKSSRYFGELESAITINNLVDTLRGILRRVLVFFRSRRYAVPHEDLPAIPEGEEPSEMKVVLTLDGDPSGLAEVPINVCGSKATAPSNVAGAYECAHQIIEYLKGRRDKALKGYVPSGIEDAADDPAWLREAIEQSGASADDKEYLRYYITRLSVDFPMAPPATSFAEKLTSIKAILAWVANNLCKGHAVPKLETQQTMGPDAFAGAFARYAPGVRFSDIVYLHDTTNMLSGKGGFLIGVDSFAVDGAQSGQTEGQSVMPVRYDDLLCVLRGGRKRLVLVYRDGRTVTLALDGYAHYLFAAINCILYMRAS